MARKTFCQSCSMPLDGKVNGSEKDGSMSQKYCLMCYKDGKFIDSNMTLDKMTAIVDKVLKEEKGWGRFRRYMARSYLPKLERWKQS